MLFGLTFLFLSNKHKETYISVSSLLNVDVSLPLVPSQIHHLHQVFILQPRYQ